MAGIWMTKENYSESNSKHSNEPFVKPMDKNTGGGLVAESVTYKHKFIWTYVIFIALGHICAIHGLVFKLTEAKLLTIIWTMFLIPVGNVAINMGAHRLYTHRAFKVNKWIEIIIVASYSIVPHRCIWRWVLDHRQHHKYCDTDADPHNSKRGFYFSHMGWLMYDQHPEVLRTKKTINMSDMKRNSVIMFQKKYYYSVSVLMGIIFPTIVPYYLWGEDLYTAFYVCSILRMTCSLHGLATINSFSHMYGRRPFNREIQPGENLFVSIVSFGEGWHNFHHSFPWDYRASKYGQNWNLTTRVIDYCAKKGWVYDLKEATPEFIKKYCDKHGDGNYSVIEDSQSNSDFRSKKRSHG